MGSSEVIRGDGAHGHTGQATPDRPWCHDSTPLHSLSPDLTRCLLFRLDATDTEKGMGARAWLAEQAEHARSSSPVATAAIGVLTSAVGSTNASSCMRRRSSLEKSRASSFLLAAHACALERVLPKP